jgi:hypothetical protein
LLALPLCHPLLLVAKALRLPHLGLLGLKALLAFAGLPLHFLLPLAHLLLLQLHLPLPLGARPLLLLTAGLFRGSLLLALLLLLPVKVVVAALGLRGLHHLQQQNGPADRQTEMHDACVHGSFSIRNAGLLEEASFDPRQKATMPNHSDSTGATHTTCDGR